MIASGAINERDLDEFRALLDTPEFVDLPQFALAAWGQRPSPR